MKLLNEWLIDWLTIQVDCLLKPQYIHAQIT